MEARRNGPASGPTDWKRRLEAPMALKLYVMHTGEVRTGGNIHFNPHSPKFKSMPKEERFNPVYAYLVQHPRKGLLLLDTGLHHSFATSRLGNFGLLLGTLVRGRTEPGKDVRSQLRSLGASAADIRHIVLSHLHLDHPSGLSYFAGRSEIDICVDPDELCAARSPFGFLKGYVKGHLKGIDFRPVRYDVAVPPFDRVCDYFGDGSVYVVGTPGHTVGHCSVLLNAAEGPILLTFDAVHRKANLDEGIPPAGDYSRAMASLKAVETFAREVPGTRVVFGHDPDQAGSLSRAPDCYR